MGTLAVCLLFLVGPEKRRKASVRSDPDHTLPGRAARGCGQVVPFFRYIKLVLLAHSKLPKYAGAVWRGVNKDLSAEYPEEKIVVWWAFSSCTKSAKVRARLSLRLAASPWKTSLSHCTGTSLYRQTPLL